MNFATTKERIVHYIDFKGIKVKEFYKITGIKRGFLDSDKLKSSVSDTFLATIIAKFTDINPIWLLTGQGSMLKEPAQPVPVQEIHPSNNDKYTALLEKNIAIMEAQLKDKDKILALQEDKIADLERRLAFAEVKDKEEMSLKIKTQRKENKAKDEIIFAQNEEINALKSRHLPPDEPLQPTKGL